MLKSNDSVDKSLEEKFVIFNLVLRIGSFGLRDCAEISPETTPFRKGSDKIESGVDWRWFFSMN